MKESLVTEMFMKLQELAPAFTEVMDSKKLTVDIVELLELEAGAMLARQGHPCERLYYIADGGLQHYEHSTAGIMITTDVSEPGDIICLCHLDSSGEYIEHLRAATDATILCISIQTIRRLRNNFPQLQQALSSLHYYHVTTRREKWLRFISLNTEQRLTYLHDAFREKFYTAKKEALASMLGICKSKLYNLLSTKQMKALLKAPEDFPPVEK